MSQFAQFHSEVVQRLSRLRLAPYLTACGGDLDAALRLYPWNMRAGSAFFESLHLLEVGVRNAVPPGSIGHSGLFS